MGAYLVGFLGEVTAAPRGAALVAAEIAQAGSGSGSAASLRLPPLRARAGSAVPAFPSAIRAAVEGAAANFPGAVFLKRLALPLAATSRMIAA
jgi:hypothetical protein